MSETFELAKSNYVMSETSFPNSISDVKAESDGPGKNADDSLRDFSFEVASFDCDFEPQTVSDSKQISDTGNNFSNASQKVIFPYCTVTKDKNSAKPKSSEQDKNWFDQDDDSLADLANADSDNDFIPDNEEGPELETRTNPNRGIISRTDSNDNAPDSLGCSTRVDSRELMFDQEPVKSKFKKVNLKQQLTQHKRYLP